MSEYLSEREFEREYEKLIADGNHPLDVKTVELAQGQGVLKRGTVIAKDSGGNFLAIDKSGLTAQYILTDDCDTGSSAAKNSEPAGKVTATVYKSGSFLLAGLITANDYELSEDDVHNLELVGNYVK